jgi:CBS domain-containing protein
MRRHEMSKRVRDVMTSQPPAIAPSAFVKSAAELRARQDIGSLPVVDERGQLWHASSLPLSSR